MGYTFQLPHSIIIQTYDVDGYKQASYGSYTSFKLAPSSRPVIQPAKPYSKELTSNWLNGSIDISNILSAKGLPSLGNKTCEIEFYVLNALDGINAGQWYQRYDDILSSINGMKSVLVLQDWIKPGIGYSWTYGRVSVKSWKSEKDRSKVTLSFKLLPYKLFDPTPPENWPTGPDGNAWPPTPDLIPPWADSIWKYGGSNYSWKWNGLFGTAINFGYFEVHGGDGTWKDIINPTNATIEADVVIQNGDLVATRYTEFDYSRESEHGETITLAQGYNQESLILKPNHNYYYFNSSNGSAVDIQVLVIRDASMEVGA